MRKTLFSILTTFVILLASQGAMGQTYQTLWKQVNDAERKDLPQTQRKVLRQIVLKAEKEKNYGQLLKAELTEAKVLTDVSPDSLASAVERLKKREETAQNHPLRAVYQVVIGRIYDENRDLSRGSRASIVQSYFSKAMQHPQELAAVKAADYSPLVTDGADSHYFGDDLLSVIGYETKQFETMHRYYVQTSNRAAQLLSGIEWIKSLTVANSTKVAKLDSLMSIYGDMPECGEAAIARYECWERSNADITPEEKVSFIDDALKRWGSWKRMNILRNSRNSLTNPEYHAEVDHKLNIPNREEVVRLTSLRNVQQMVMNVYRVNADGKINLNPNIEKDYRKLESKLTLLPLTQTHRYEGKKEYEFFTDSFQLAPLPVGVYLLEFESKPETNVSRSFYYVSDLRVLSQQLPDHKTRYVVVNATTGKPIERALVHLADQREKAPVEVFETDENGEYVYEQANVQYPYVYVMTEADKAFPGAYIYGGFSYNDIESTSIQASIFTDRAIYRPGQKVQAAAIFYEVTNGYQHRPLAGKSVTARLLDANDEEVKKVNLTTDEYGTVAADFILPSSGLTGEFTVDFDGHRRDFRVEEYKRPTFFVEFPEVTKNYKAGDTLNVRAQAKSYAGVPVQQARVSYTVERRMPFWWFSYHRYWQRGVGMYRSSSITIFKGEAMTDADGYFDVQMPLLLPEDAYPQFYNFVVVADVTDGGGETRQGQLSLPLGNRDAVFTLDLADKMRVDQMKPLKLNLLNAAGNELGDKARYRVDNGKWVEVMTGTSVTLPKLKRGQHEVMAVCGNDTVSQKFIVFSLDDKEPVVQTDDWFYVSDEQFADATSPVTVQVGSSAKNMHLLYTIVAGDKLIESGAVKLSGRLLNRKFIYHETYGNGITLSFAWVREGKTFTHEAVIRRPLPDKKLHMKWETFRNRLTPGEQEEWKLTVADADGKAVAAQLMATLYDKSLDQIEQHAWSFVPAIWLPTASVSWCCGLFGEVSCWGSSYSNYLSYTPLKLRRLDSSCFPNIFDEFELYESSLRLRGAASRKAMAKMALTEEAEMMMDARASNVTMDAIGSSDDTAEEKAEADTDQPTETAELQIRQNLNETAFFYPQLQADSTGCVTLRFTLPESLTTWRFMGVAHTNDMKYGMLQDEAVAKKDVMIQPNMPRFVRVGDQITISARIINTTDQAIGGTAFMQLSDAESDRVVLALQSTYSLGANESNTVSFPIDGTKLSDCSLLVCKMTARGETYSDGEQHYLPVLPNQERVTVTVPFTQNHSGTKTISLENIVPASAKSAKLTFEYTNNPAWLMIQAMPTVGHPHDNCAICQAASYYANSIGRFVLKQNPHVVQVFEQWKQEGTELKSSLEKNEELKDLLLNETPWVMDADREEEQKQRLADFFDQNLMNARISAAVSQLQQLQRPDGSWSWWSGMNGSFYITVEVSEMLVRLNNMVSYQPDTPRMLTKAFRYMDEQIVELVKEMKKNEKKGYRQVFPSHKALQYLYLCTLDGREHSVAVNAAQQYLKKLLKKETTRQTLYEKALSAIILNSPFYMKSLKEYTVYREDVGRYYDAPRASYSWRDYRIPTQVAAIEAMQRLTPQDTVTIDQMRRWLLHEKGAQAWDTPINSVNAIYAFMNGNSHFLTSQPLTVLKVDGKELQTSKATAGVGYVKTSVQQSASEDDKAKTFTALKTSAGTSWGAVYAQFMQPTQDIADQGSEISVKREILYSDSPNTADDPSVQPTLYVGQRIRVRLTIEAKRDLDFVEVIDRRAACMEPVGQISGYRQGAYCAPKDNATHYFYDMMRKGRHVIETEYYLDRAGTYQTGTCIAQCAYAPQFRATTRSLTINVEEHDK